MNNDKIKEITNQIIADIENGSFNFKYNWKTTGQPPQNYTSGHVYKGMNAFYLKYSSSDTYFLTFLQAKEKGIKIKAGEKGKQIMYWKMLDRKPTGKDSINDKTKIPFMRLSYVFGLTQTDKIEENVNDSIAPIPTAEDVINNYNSKPEILIGDREPCFVPALNKLFIPSLSNFKDTGEYYSTFFHELAHSTAIPLKRDITDYSKEELIAELSTSIICNYLGIETQFTKDNSRAYLTTWIKNANESPRYLIKIIDSAEEIFRLICFNECPDKKE